MGGFRRERRRDRVWGETDNKNIFSNFLSFVDILAMITSYRNKAYLLNCEKFQKDKKTNIAD